MVEIKKLEKLTWGAKHQVSGELLQKFDECKDIWMPGISKKTRAYVTGLNETERKKFEKELFLESGTLSPNSDYWANFSILIPRDGLRLFPDADPLQRLQLHVIKACPETAHSKQEGMSIKSKIYYIHDEDNEAVISNNKREAKIKAYIALDKLTRDEVIDVLYMMGLDPGDLSNEVARNVLGKEVDADPRTFANIIDDEFFKDKLWIVNLIRKGVLHKASMGSGYDLPIKFGDIILGNNLIDSVSFLKRAENSNVLEAIKEQEAAYK